MSSSNTSSSSQKKKFGVRERKQFGKYLERNGVIDALAQILVDLYEENRQPHDALQYIRNKLAKQADLDTHETLKVKLEIAYHRIKQVERENEHLRRALEQRDGRSSRQSKAPPSTPVSYI